MYYIIKLYYFVAVLSLTRLFCQRFLKIKNVDKIKNVKNVTIIKKRFTSMSVTVTIKC